MGPIIASATGQEFELAPTGNQQAVCAYVEDIGTQLGQYQGKPTSRHQVVIAWELAEHNKQGIPFLLSKFYTVSLGKKATLRADLESWRGKPFTEKELMGFDLTKLVGANCLLNVVATTNSEGSEKRKIVSVSPCVKGMAKLAIANATPPEGFAKFIAKLREQSVEVKGSGTIDEGGDSAPPPSDNDAPPPEDDVLPF